MKPLTCLDLFRDCLRLAGGMLAISNGRISREQFDHELTNLRLMATLWIGPDTSGDSRSSGAAQPAAADPRPLVRLGPGGDFTRDYAPTAPSSVPSVEAIA